MILSYLFPVFLGAVLFWLFPGHRKECLEEIQSAFQQWSDATGAWGGWLPSRLPLPKEIDWNIARSKRALPWMLSKHKQINIFRCSWRYLNKHVSAFFQVLVSKRIWLFCYHQSLSLFLLVIFWRIRPWDFTMKNPTILGNMFFIFSKHRTVTNSRPAVWKAPRTGTLVRGFGFSQKSKGGPRDYCAGVFRKKDT